MKNYLKKLQDQQITAILTIAAVVVMSLTLALTLNNSQLQDNLLNRPPRHGSATQQPTQQVKKPATTPAGKVISKQNNKLSR